MKIEGADNILGISRVAAYIGSLKEEGYQILDSNDGTEYYTLLGYSPKVPVTDQIQEAYYRTDHWKAIRAERQRKDGWKCCICRGNDRIEVHHWRYTLFSEDVERDVVTLCHDCHFNIVHESTMHWPNYVDPEIARRIREESK